MEFFMAYTPWDFPFPAVDADCRLLLSPTTFSPFFSYPAAFPPRAVLIDSGAYHHNHRRAGKSSQEALDAQLRVLERLPPVPEVALLHCDVLPRDDLPAERAVQATLANAEWFADAPLGAGVERIAVAQARHPDEMFLVVRYLAELGYRRIALGGLANLHRVHRARLPPMIEAAVEAADGVALHALGVTAAHVLTFLEQSGVRSVDSATATWSAIYGSVMYSHPLRRFRLSGEKSNRPGSPHATGYYQRLAAPLPCECPVCRDDPAGLQGHSMEAKYRRSIHNYYQMKLEIEGGDAWREACSSAEYQSVITTLRNSARTSRSTRPPRSARSPGVTRPADASP